MIQAGHVYEAIVRWSSDLFYGNDRTTLPCAEGVLQNYRELVGGCD